MVITGVNKAVVFAALLILLSACGESNEVYEESSVGDATVSASGINETESDGSVLSADDSESTTATSTTATSTTANNEPADPGQDTTDSAGTDTVTTAEDTEASDTSTPDTTAQSQQNDDLDANTLGLPTDGVAQFATSACGSLPISTATHSNAMSAPTVMTTGQLVSSVIGAGSTTNREHYWSIALEPGDYHVVLDSKSADGAYTNLALRLSELHTDGGITDLFSDNNAYDYRNRSHGFFTVLVARTLLLRITPNFAVEEYTFGIFANGSAVPSPLFSDCPTIKPLSVDTVEALILPEQGGSAGDRWYRADLAAGLYSLSSWAARTDGSSSTVHYKLTQVDQFGQIGRTEEFGNIQEMGPVTNIISTDLARENSGPVWIRIQNLFVELTMEFTLNAGI